jgi:hypothetical protein
MMGLDGNHRTIESFENDTDYEDEEIINRSADLIANN